MNKEELIQIKNFLNDVFSRFRHLEEFNITEVPIPKGLENNGEEEWYNNYEISSLLEGLEQKSEEDIKCILMFMREALEIFSDWHCEIIEEYENEMPKEFNEAMSEEVNSYYLYSSSGSIKTWINNNFQIA